MFALVREDIAAVKDRDPAAKSSFEVMLLYQVSTPCGVSASTIGCGPMAGNSLPARYRRLRA